MTDFFETTIKNYSGLSTETKPTIAGGTDVPNGSRWREVDAVTEQITYFYFSLANDAWYPETQRMALYDPINDRQLELEVNGGVPVNIQDQTTRAFDTRINQFDKTGITLATPPIVDSYDVTLTAGHGVIGGDRLAVIEQNGIPQLYSGLVLNVAVNVITLDSPVPFAFTVGATVITTIIDMTVDGSTTTEIFSITNVFAEAVDITRLIVHITDSTVMDDAKFGGDVALTRGLVLRKKISASQYINYWNVKTNGEFGELAYDKTYDSKAPSGVYGLTVRITYSGQDKHGVVIRLEPGETIEVLVQDDFTVYDSFTVMFQGHSTQD